MMFDECGKTGNMVAVLMGQQDSVNVIQGQPELFQRRADAPGGDARIHKEMHISRRQQQAVALRAAGKCMYSEQI